MEKAEKKIMDFSKTEEAHPYYDMYSSQYIRFDRLEDSWEIVKDEILDYAYRSNLEPFDDKSKEEGKVILLMYERAYRKGHLVNGKVDINNKDEINKLSALIDYFIKIKAEFKTLDKY